MEFGLFLSQFGCRGNAVCSLKNSDSIFEYYNLKNYQILLKCHYIAYGSEICAFLFVLIWLLWQPLCSIKIFITIFEFAIRENPTICKHCLHILCRTESCIILDYFGLILVTMAIPLTPTKKKQVAYLNSTTPHTLLYMHKIPRFLARN